MIRRVCEEPFLLQSAEFEAEVPADLTSTGDEARRHGGLVVGDDGGRSRSRPSCFDDGADTACDGAGRGVPRHGLRVRLRRSRRPRVHTRVDHTKPDRSAPMVNAEERQRVDPSKCVELSRIANTRHGLSAVVVGDAVRAIDTIRLDEPNVAISRGRSSSSGRPLSREPIRDGVQVFSHRLFELHSDEGDGLRPQGDATMLRRHDGLDAGDCGFGVGVRQRSVFVG